MDKIFNTTSVDFIMDGMRQIVEKIPITRENADAHHVLRHYLAKYNTAGTLTQKELYEMHIILKFNN